MVHQGGLEIEVDGVVVPFREITLSAEVEGRILYKADDCRAGRYVEKGTLLLKIDPRDYELEIRRLKTGLDGADDVDTALAVQQPAPNSLIGLAERDLQLQRKEFERLKGLEGGRMVSDSEIEQGERSVIMGENTLLSLQSQLERTMLDLARTEIVAPIEGVVVNDSVEQGDFVRRGTPLVTIEDTSKAEVKCSLRMDELYWLWNQAGSGNGDSADQTPQADYQIPQAPVTVVYRLGGRDFQWNGVLSRYDGIGLDETTRTVPCRAVVNAPRGRTAPPNGPPGPADQSTGPPALVRGMYVTVRIHADPNADLLEVPEAAVRPGSKVWAVRGGKLAIVDVHVVRVAHQRAILGVGEVKAGEKVVVTPLAVAEDGMAVGEKSDP
jgi:multidrug efflux pump subunit AcrA (membrane-fusion protein)